MSCSSRKNLGNLGGGATGAGAGAGAAKVGSGPTLWRSLDELAKTPEFEAMLHREFPTSASEWNDGPEGPNGPSRRNFLKLMAASLALAGVGGAGCTRKPTEKIIPYVIQPEDVVLGKPLFFATAQTRGGYARGVLAESHEGRPTKIEGNPDHPASLGATDIIAQASVLGLYDPDRSQTVTRVGEVSNWDPFINVILGDLEARRTTGGKGLRILTQTITSPTLAAQMAALLATYPQAKWHQYDPIGCDNARAGAKLAFGKSVQPIYHFEAAKVIVSLDDNFLFDHPGSVRYAREFINGRRVRSGRREMNRLYVAESTPTITGAMADHKLRIKPSAIAEALKALIGHAGANDAAGEIAAWAKAAAADLQANHGAGLVVVGENQPPIVHAAAHQLNVSLGNVGKTVSFIEPVEAGAVNHGESLRQLVSDMNAGAVETLLMLGGNPVYDAPADVDFLSALKKVPLRIHHSLYDDETSFQCHWHLPAAHELESWGDARAFDGTASIIQPLIAPLYQGRTAIEVLSILTKMQDRSGYELIRDYWQKQHNSADFESFWEKSVRDGLIAGTASPAVNVALSGNLQQSIDSAWSTTQPAAGGMEISFRPDPSVWDGTYANNGWLQELPKPLTRITWDNVALMSARTAKQLGVIDTYNQPGNQLETSVVELNVDGRIVRAPAWLTPGQPDDVITVYLGYGRKHAGRVGTDAGFNAYALRSAANPWFAGGLKVNPTDDKHIIACTQNHFAMDQHDRDLVHVASVGEYDKMVVHDRPQVDAEGKRVVPLSLFPSRAYPNNKWGMVIDQNACIGCNACVLACQSENNIPVVGKEQVTKGREMQWLRIDTYFGGEEHAPDGPFFQPLLCMHCETAPCEVVCPVEATLHDSEGINNMVYNRCIGTRYCSNNCPYKVRHFNFLHFSEEITGPLKMLMNPDVTVRSRGVMEKCSYCIQRINHGRIDAKKEDRPINDGEIVTACAQVCPTQAIVFGNLNDSKAAVTKLAAEPTNYGLLDELQTQPRTTYLPRFINPAAQAATTHGGEKA